MSKTIEVLTTADGSPVCIATPALLEQYPELQTVTYARRTGASMNRSGSRQDYETPAEFMRAVERHFGEITFDLAASLENSKAPRCFTVADDSLVQDWAKLSGTLWLNYPFGKAALWLSKAAKTAREREGRIITLTPMSMGTKWWRENVHGQAHVYSIGRLAFVGEQHPFPKDLALAVYGEDDGFTYWDWRRA